MEKAVANTIKKYRLIGWGEKVFVAVSGGKDSSALLSILNSLKGDFKLDLYAVHIDLGINQFSNISKKIVETLAETLGLKLIVLDLQDLLGAGLPSLASLGKRPPCSICGMIKRYLLNVVGFEAGASVATGHTLEDTAVYLIKNLFSGDYESMGKIGPFLPGERGAAKRIKPLSLIYEDYLVKYVEAKNIPHVREECPFKNSSTLEVTLRRMLNKIEQKHPGLTYMMVKSFFEKKPIETSLYEKKVCRYCGLLSKDDVCSFCKYTERSLGEPMGPAVREKIKSVLRGFIVG